MGLKLYTIGFTRKSAKAFFTLLQEAEVRCILDVRLNNASQLAGFAKRDDLAYFAKTIGNIEYLHLPILAPTQEMLDAYRKEKRGWDWYEQAYLDLLEERAIETALKPETLDRGCLLCSEDTPDFCHRRLVVEYLEQKWGDIVVHHLV